MFDYEGMDELAALSQIRLRGLRRDAPGGRLATRSEVAGLLPGGGLMAGSAYAVGPSHSLVMLLISGPSGAGAWCSVVGMPGFGLEAAEEYGIDLGRLAMVPSPGERWLQVVATLADTMPVVAVRPPGAVSPGEAARLAARLRRRGGVLIAVGRWPRAAASLSLTTEAWSGLGRGHGVIAGRRAVVDVRLPDGRSARRDLLLPPPRTAPEREQPAASLPARGLQAGLRAVV